MKNKHLLLLFTAFFMLTLPVFAGQLDGTLAAENARTSENIAAAPQQMEKAHKKAMRKEARKAMIKQLFSRDQASEDLDPIILILLAIIIPPLAVYLYDGDATNRFWLNLVLFLLGYGALGFLGFYYFGGLLAIIHALLIVTGTI
ncbi:MAG: YqaE/Pmp3 family membrane protein [Bacteroidia bacterium]|nr:YqaE/Pmp3 family membrane protein [Bacteroidia bacterium]